MTSSDFHSTNFRTKAEEVVAHAAMRRQRGRRPSMSYRDERNPRKALAMATAVIAAKKKKAKKAVVAA